MFLKFLSNVEKVATLLGDCVDCGKKTKCCKKGILLHLLWISSCGKKTKCCKKGILLHLLWISEDMWQKKKATAKKRIQRCFFVRKNCTVNVFIMLLRQSQTKTRYFPPMVSENSNFCCRNLTSLFALGKNNPKRLSKKRIRARVVFCLFGEASLKIFCLLPEKNDCVAFFSFGKKR